MKEVVDVLLGSQFVRSEAANLMYQVVEGSGMGLPHSAGIADSAFYHKAERGMVEKDALESVGIDMLVRYRDDILILANSYEKFIAWFQKLKSKAGFFKLQCEEIVRFSKVGDKEVQFLQFRVQMNGEIKAFETYPSQQEYFHALGTYFSPCPCSTRVAKKACGSHVQPGY